MKKPVLAVKSSLELKPVIRITQWGQGCSVFTLRETMPVVSGGGPRAYRDIFQYFWNSKIVNGETQCPTLTLF